MATTATGKFKLALSLKAYGIELQLWKEPSEREWGATLRVDNDVIDCHFEEDNLTMAKLHVLGEARSRAVTQAGNTELPGCDTYLDSWKPVNMAKR